MQYQPTVYEQIVTDYLNGNIKPYSFYEREWTARGYTKKDFIQYKQDIEYAKKLTEVENFNVVAAANMAKEHVKNRDDIVTFRLLDSEKQVVMEAEDMGRIKAGEVIKYDGYKREIRGIDYMDIPKEVDAFVVFSGHPGTGMAAVEAWYNDLMKTGKPKKLVFLGLHDNQGNTNFNTQGLKFNTKSEVEMYVRFFRELGVPKKFIKENLITPKDISTADNIDMLAMIRNNFFSDNDKQGKDVNFAMFGYPAYQKRIASEFAYGFQKLEDEGKVKGTNFYIPDAPVSQNENERYFSYDDLNGICQDICIGNCMAHPYRVKAGGRFDSKLGKYPEKFKPLLALSLVYSYPNVANELAGTDLKVGAVMKILRAMQHKVKEWEDPVKVDATIRRGAKQLRKKMLSECKINNEIASKKGNRIRLNKFMKFYKGAGR